MAGKRRCATMLFLNERNEILLFLRDNKPEIRYPNMWDMPGGGCEKGEDAESCIIREMDEELPGLDLGEPKVFSVEENDDRIDTIFWTRITAPIDLINEILTEGQCAAYFSERDVRGIELAFDGNPVVERFFTALREGTLS